MTEHDDSGLYEKYEVYKDGEAVPNSFVLEPESDAAAREALIRYAEATDDEELATDLREWVTDLCTRDEERLSTDHLAARIDETRITYEQRDHGVRISGSPFICEFDEPVDPQSFIETITTTDDPWQMFGVSTSLSSEDDYRKVVGTLFHVDDEGIDGASEVALEVCSEWVRIYAKGDASAERLATFVQDLDREFGVSVAFSSGAEPDDREVTDDG